MSIYRYFGSKEGLVEATLRFRGGRVRQRLADGAERFPPGPQRVLAIFDLFSE